ncbi:MAG: energy transducer TonB [Deltaproteobacteria bacterium]|nr:energy transducer TonB [Deltaproteobacteria bacterium]
MDDLLAVPPAWHRWVRSLAIPVSVALHLLAALLLVRQPVEARPEAEWIEMAIHQPAPAPPAPPPPVERPRTRSKAPDPVPFSETVKEATTPDRPPPPAVRRIQGLSASSFAQGSGTGLSVRAGNTLAVPAGPETADIGEVDAGALLPVTSVTTQPRACSKPPVEVPKEAIDASVEGSWRMVLDLDAQGRVTSVRFLDIPTYGLEEACRAAALRIRCRPARKDGVPVAVTGMPHRCTVRALD